MFCRVQNAGLATAISANGVDALLQQREDSSADPLVVYFHGGGYAVASALAYRSYCSPLVKRADVRVLNVDYRRAPEHPFPAATVVLAGTRREQACLWQRWS